MVTISCGYMTFLKMNDFPFQLLNSGFDSILHIRPGLHQI